jgi:hypothetical protein
MGIKERRCIQRRVLISDVGNHYHLEMFCPMVQDPQGPEYHMGLVESADRDSVIIKGKHYMACSCVDHWFDKG